MHTQMVGAAVLLRSVKEKGKQIHRRLTPFLLQHIEAIQVRWQAENKIIRQVCTVIDHKIRPEIVWVGSEIFRGLAEGCICSYVTMSTMHLDLFCNGSRD